MSSYDDLTDNEISDLLEKCRLRLSTSGLLHAGEDATIIQAVKRLEG